MGSSRDLHLAYLPLNGAHDIQFRTSSSDFSLTSRSLDANSLPKLVISRSIVSEIVSDRRSALIALLIINKFGAYRVVTSSETIDRIW